mmetsp:Transcript_15673/g.32421  ORF Transcript_15673/g.32421 Transcript_15673/m.32421 type:complete len:209 (-) Transcript_15673:1279-1905(-)
MLYFIFSPCKPHFYHFGNKWLLPLIINHDPSTKLTVVTTHSKSFQFFHHAFYFHFFKHFIGPLMFAFVLRLHYWQRKRISSCQMLLYRVQITLVIRCNPTFALACIEFIEMCTIEQTSPIDTLKFCRFFWFESFLNRSEYLQFTVPSRCSQLCILKIIHCEAITASNTFSVLMTVFFDSRRSASPTRASAAELPSIPSEKPLIAMRCA